jgi:hypothetical protein
MSGSSVRPRVSLRVLRGSALGLALAAAVLSLRAPTARAAGPFSPAIIGNGTVSLGVNPEGHLNVPDSGIMSLGDSDGDTWVQDGFGNIVSGPDYTGTETFGLRFDDTGAESTAPAFAGEGWGIAAYATDTTTLLGKGFAQLGDPLSAGLICDDFTADADSAISVVHIEDGDGNPLLQVTHDFHPTSSPFLYEITVTIENLTSGGTAQTIVPRYRRVFDWDVEPTPFWEFTSMVGVEGALPGVLEFANNDGFATADADGPPEFDIPGFIVPPVIERSNEDYDDAGPDDQGATFGFLLEPLAPGAMRQFFVYYGGSPTTAQTVAALNSLNIQLYSIAKPTIEAGELGVPDDGDSPDDSQNTFAFGFRQVGEACPFTQCFWPPNHKYETLSIQGVPEDAEVVIDSITSDEHPCAEAGSGGQIHSPDAVIGSGNSFQIRIERSGQGNGRVYGVHYTVTFADGDQTSATAFYCVPHDQSDKKKEDGSDCCDCVDDGQQYDATEECSTKKK